LFFWFFCYAALINVLAADFSFIYYIYHNQFNLALIAICISYILAGIVTYYFYKIDKDAACKGNWRTPERRLHQLELIGGWIGAFVAQKRLRHKSIKPSYQLVYWLIVIFHLSLFLLFLPVILPHLMWKKYVVSLNFFLLVIALKAK
jgi:uncharacterized membrane protein YsdA (DUF1294 family)